MKKLLFSVLMALPLIFITSCTNDDAIIIPGEISQTYQLFAASDSSISGTAKIIKNDDDSITLEIELSGTSAGDIHPAHIHANTAAESGGILVTLDPVDGTTGKSSTTFSALDNSTTVTYAEMLNFNGYINVHFSAANLMTLVAQGDIGQNELTGTNSVYTIDEVNASGVSGTAVFSQRANGNTLISFSINGTQSGTNHRTVLNDGSVSEGGSVAITLNNINGDTGTSFTSISKKDDDTPITYQDLTIYDGHINIFASLTALTVAAQGDIGQNALN